MADPLWIFGYGSLVWRPAFSYEERRAAFVRGWTRRFWQGSTDHRGTPGAPGRVVTLIQQAGAICWGAAYRVEGCERDRVLADLDHREKGGYERHELDLHLEDGSTSGLVYVATAENGNFLGPAPLEDIAAQVEESQGPSGPNLEYVLRLAQALRELDAEDEHVYALEQLLRNGR